MSQEVSQEVGSETGPGVYPDVCMVGSAMTDLVVRVPRLPAAGETLGGSSFFTGFGGKGSNQAVMAARLGARVSVVAKLGRDAFGEATLQNYRDQGVDPAFVSFDDARPSGVALITVDEGGQNSIVIVPGANDGLSPDDVRRAQGAVTGARVLLCQLETPLEATLEAFRLARAAGTRTVLNPAPSRALSVELLRLTDLLIPNEVEAAALLGQPVGTVAQAQAAAQAFLEQGPKAAIITLGARGAVVAAPGQEPEHVSAEPVRAVDTTGAGDAFVGSLAYLLSRDWPLHEAARRACAVAARSVLKEGTQTSFPSRAEVAALLG